MLKQAQKMQEDMQNLQAELDEQIHEVSAGGGVVNIKIKGNREISEIHLDKDIVDPDDIETLEDLITAAVNEALSTVEKHNSEQINKLTSGLGVPGMF